MKTLNQYLTQNINQIVMISLSVDAGESFQYNHWNWFSKNDQIHLLRDDYSLGHILNTGSITENEDGSISYSSEYHPKNCIINFYFGGAKLN